MVIKLINFGPSCHAIPYSKLQGKGHSVKEFTNSQTLIDNYIMTNITAAKTMDNICANMPCITEINSYK